MSKLALIRHGESEWNALDLWTGWSNCHLTNNGRRQAKEAGEKLKNINWDYIFESDLIRSHETTDEIIEALDQSPQRIQSPKIKERDYGNFTGLDKNEIENRYGYEIFEKWHRGWDFPLPHGETLKDVSCRVIPYFESEILPKLKDNKNIIVSAHGNSLRALVKHIENIPEDQLHLQLLEIPVGTILIYEVNPEGIVTPTPFPTQ